MRISYSDEEGYPGQFDLWQANCDRSIAGKKGQAALRELEQALLALPEKRLIADSLQDSEGGVCAIGALAKHRGYKPKSPDWDMQRMAVEMGVPELVGWKIVALNDVECKVWFDPHSKQYIDYTPEKRYEDVLAQVRKWINDSKAL